MRVQTGSVLVVARMTALDLLRRPGTWTVTLLTGLLFAVLFAGIAAVNTRTRERAEKVSFSISVDGDLAGGAKFVEQLRTERLLVSSVGDAAEWVASSRASAGLTIPDALDRRLVEGQTTEVRVYFRGKNTVSQEAYNTLLIRMQQLELAAGSRLLHPTSAAVPPQPAQVEIREVKQDPRVNRDQFAAALAAMACVLCLGTVSSVTGAFGRSQEQRTLEPMLLIPMGRTALGSALALGAFPVAVLQLLAAQTLLIVATALPGEGLQQPLGEVGRMLLLGMGASILLGGLATATGCLAGSIGVGTDDAVGLGDFLSLPFVGVGVLLFLSPDLPATVALSLVPIIGPALVLRDGVRGNVGLASAVVAIVATAAWMVLAVNVAGRRVAAERRLLRATS